MMGKTGLIGLRNAVAGALFSLTAGSSPIDIQSTQENAPPQDARFFMSEETDKTYGAQINFIRDYVPGLTALVLTDNELGVEITEEDKKNIQLMMSCAGYTAQPTKETIDTTIKIKQAQDNLYGIIRNLSEGEDPMLRPEDLQNAVANNPRDFMDDVFSATIHTLIGSEASISFKKFFPNDRNINFAIIPLSSKMDSVEENILGLTGLPAEYTENIQSTVEDLSLMTLGHEIGGHAFHKHGGRDNSYDCVIINSDSASESNIEESVGDIAASIIYKDAQVAGLTSPANTPEEHAALRALGSLYLASNNSAYTNTTDLNTHVTTVMLDTKSPDFQSDIDIANMPSVSVLPLYINRVADAISGYFLVVDLMERMKKNPDGYSKQQHDYFGALSTNPRDFSKHFDAFAEQGLTARHGIYGDNGELQEKPDYETFYEAVSFIKKHGLLDQAASGMAEDYAIAMKDLIDDFLAAAEKHAPKLKTPEVSARIENTFKKEDFNFLTLEALTAMNIKYKTEEPPKPQPEAETQNVPQI